MKKVLMITAVLISLTLPVLAEEVPAVVEPEAIVKTEAEKTLDTLVEQYKVKQKELIAGREDLLRLEGAIILAQDIVKKEKAKTGGE